MNARMKPKETFLVTFVIVALGSLVPTAAGRVCNIKLVTDACPDYHDIDGMIHSITGKWNTPAQKCWALFYQTHIARRQTSPMMVHGIECTDPIRQFNDYGYTMCSTVAGINCSVWDAMGYKVKFWDITAHTVPEVYYEGRWHMYDNSMSALYTLCDGRTIAGVEDIGRPGGCPASAGRVEPGHIARYHCLNATSSNGFLTGADCARDLAQEHRCFNPNALKYRYYYNNWDRGHRYILNLRRNEVYTRYYASLGQSAEYYVANKGRDPEQTNPRYRIRANGIRRFRPDLTAGAFGDGAYSFSDCRPTPEGIVPVAPGRAGQVVFKIEGSNVIASLSIDADFLRTTEQDTNRLLISTTNGLTWRQIWSNDKTGTVPVSLKLTKEVSGCYDVLVKAVLTAEKSASDARLGSIEFKAVTMLNSKTQPRLLLGANTVYVGAAAQSASIVVSPDLQGDNYRPYVVDEKNMTAEPEHIGYQGVMHAIRASEEAYVVFRVDAPGDITAINYGGRFYNRAPKSHIDLLHSFDAGRTWVKDYSLTDTEPPWDVIHYESLSPIPQPSRSVLFKYLLGSSAAGTSACSIYGVRMEVSHAAEDTKSEPLEVTFNWSELQQDYSLKERSHTQLITSLPFRYTVNAGGCDHPVMNSLRVNLKGSAADSKYGYSDGRDAGGAKHVPTWVTYGTNLAENKNYTVSVPSNDKWGAGDPQGRKLTDGVVGPPYAGGVGPRYALCWDKGTNPEITVDLERPESCAAFRIHLSGGWPWWDALKGQVADKVEVLASADGAEYTSVGFFEMNLRWKDIPINHMMPDDETATGFNYALVPDRPVAARYVRFKITPERTLTVSEVQVLNSIRAEPYDLRIALPDENDAATTAPADRPEPPPGDAGVPAQNRPAA